MATGATLSSTVTTVVQVLTLPFTSVRAAPSRSGRWHWGHVVFHRHRGAGAAVAVHVRHRQGDRVGPTFAQLNAVVAQSQGWRCRRRHCCHCSTALAWMLPLPVAHRAAPSRPGRWPLGPRCRSPSRPWCRCSRCRSRPSPSGFRCWHRLPEQLNAVWLSTRLAIAQLSIAAVVTAAAVVLPLPVASSCTVTSWQSAVGAMLSRTRHVVVQVLLLPFTSVTVRVTVLPLTFAQLNVVLARLRLAMPQASLLPLLTAWQG
jgi:hypothetical protein